MNFKKYIRYILNTIKCRYSKCFHINGSTVKYILYAFNGKDNKIEVSGSALSKTSISFTGNDNMVQIADGASIYYSNINIIGSGNKVSLNGCSGILTLVVRGNNCNISIDKDTTMEGCYMICMGQNNGITIGKDCMFSGKVELWNSDTHLITDMDGNGINPSKPITIGNHVWLGKYVKVLKGVNIGNNSVIGMGSIVTKSVNNNSIAAGNPAKTIKENINWTKGFIEI